MNFSKRRIKMSNSRLKESNIEWLGKIPDNWKTIKFNALYDLRNEKVSDKDFPPLSVTKMGIVPQLSNAAKTNNGDNRKLVEIGDFAINSRSDRRGSCGISKYEGSVSLINTVLKPINREMNPRYYGWLFKTVEFADEFYKWGHGIVDDLWTTNWQDMKNITLVCPSKTEQNKIADFLDKKVSQIDDISKKIQQEITDLEEYRKSIITKAVTTGLNTNIQMKDSNIDYINKIPNTWHLTRLKYILTERNQRSIDGKELLLSVSQKKGILPAYQVKRSIKANSLVGYKIVKQNDLVFNKLNPALARFGVSNYNGITSPDFSVYYSNKINIQFLSFLLKTSKYVTEYKRLCSGVGEGYTRLYTPTLYNIKVALPTIKEQNKIVNILNKKDQKIKKLMEKQKRLLLTLTQYKQSLIYEYVTGKKQVSSKESAKA